MVPLLLKVSLEFIPIPPATPHAMDHKNRLRHSCSFLSAGVCLAPYRFPLLYRQYKTTQNRYMRPILRSIIILIAQKHKTPLLLKTRFCHQSIFPSSIVMRNGTFSIAFLLRFYYHEFHSKSTIPWILFSLITTRTSEPSAAKNRQPSALHLSPRI